MGKTYRKEKQYKNAREKREYDHQGKDPSQERAARRQQERSLKRQLQEQED